MERTGHQRHRVHGHRTGPPFTTTLAVMSFNEIASIVAGGIITILVTISVEVLRRPKLRLAARNTVDATYADERPAKKGRYLCVDLINDPLPWFARWMSRGAALQCAGIITFHNVVDGQRFFAREMPVRFSRTPEPVPVQLKVGEAIIAFFDPSRANAESRIDVYPGESTPLDVAVKFESEDEAYGWSNLNYFSKPPWRNPDWKLPRGRYLVEITISSSGQKCRGLFRLLNEAGPMDFRLERALPTDKARP